MREREEKEKRERLVLWRVCQRDWNDGFLDRHGGMVVSEIGGGFFCSSCGGFLLVVVGMGFI